MTKQRPESALSLTDKLEDELEDEEESVSDNNKHQATLAQVFSFADRRRTQWCLAGAFVAAAVSGLIFPAIAFFYSRAFRNLSALPTSDGFLAGIRNMSFSFMALGAIIFVSMAVQMTLAETAADDMLRALQTRWFAALLRQDMAYFDIENMGSHATILSTNGVLFRRGVGGKLAESVQFSITVLAGLGYAFYAEWRICLAILAISPFLALAARFLIRMTVGQSSHANSAYAEAGSIVSTSTSALRTILSLNAVDRMVSAYERATSKAAQRSIDYSWKLGLAHGAMWVAFTTAYIIITVFGSWLIYRQVRVDGCDPSATNPSVEPCRPGGADVFGALMGVAIAAAVLPQVSLSLEALTGARAACYPALVAINRNLEATCDRDDDVEAPKSASTLPKYEIDSSSVLGLYPCDVGGTIDFHKVSFAFPARPDAPVLDDFSLHIEGGMTVGLVGASGCGKSTVVQLIERFYDPQVGSISLDGKDLKSLNVRWLRDQIGLVLQEPKLFGKSIHENISLGAPGVTQEDVEEAAKLANAHDFIMSFPKGYDTQVGDLGNQLSGGEKQRIAIARVLVKKPKCLLLDEATSALDSESERTVQQALDRLMKLRSITTIVVAHRLSTIMNADAIAVIKDGRVVEFGPHGELLSKRGEYYHLVAEQKTSADSNDSYPRQNNNRRMSAIDASALNDVNGEALVRFREVHFRYPTRMSVEVFRGLNLSVRRGETLGLVGSSGCGKSTIVQLIERFYDPTEGVIEYNSIDLKDLNVSWLREQLGLVGQEATLFPGTIEENIRYGLADATTTEVVEAAKDANCHEFITAFPDGYATRIGEGGSLISGGQKQRIAIARAIIKKPKLLLLDESTSALDSEAEKIVQAALDNIMAKKGQTCIVIAHRLSTIRNADRIAVIDNGKVRESGTHDELMAKPDGQYRRLHDLQSLETRADAKERAEITDKKSLGARETHEAVTVIDETPELTREQIRSFKRRAWTLAKSDLSYIVVGAVGALLAGCYFPAFGFVFANMIELLYQRVLTCPPLVDLFQSCADYYNSVAMTMQDRSLKLMYGFLGLAATVTVGDVLLFWGFGSASEHMNKRVRDGAFRSLLRQEVAWFDVRSPGSISAQLAFDAAMLHAFTGEPIRTLILSFASVFVGLIVSFVFMWPFAMLVIGVLPFQLFAVSMKLRRLYGKKEEEEDENSPGAIVSEALGNMRTVASLGLEKKLTHDYELALALEHPTPLLTNLSDGGAAGLGQGTLMWIFALLIFWGGWLLSEFPTVFTYQSFLISMFALMFSLHGASLAKQGAMDGDKAKAAAARIYELTDRKSEIDPLGEGGRKEA